MKKQNLIEGKKAVVLITASILIGFSGYGVGLDAFATMSSSFTLSQPDLFMEFDTDSLTWRSPTSTTVNLNDTNQFNYTFPEEKTWYDLNVSLELSLQNDKIDNISSYTFEAFDSDNQVLGSCNSVVNSEGKIECGTVAVGNNAVKGFNLSFDKDDLSAPKLESDSKIDLEAD